MPIEMPPLGLGTYQLTDPEECARSVERALEVGYRHIDTAQMYNNEAHVGEGIAAADVPREDVFLASKVTPGNLAYEAVIESTEESREKLGVDTIDLMYVHWPTQTYDVEETIPALDELVDRGTIRHVGVSNFTPELLDEARDVSDHPIVANQVEMHPLLQQDELVEYTREHDMWTVAYSPLAKGEVFDVPVLSDIADKHGVNEVQVTLAWFLQKDNVAAIPKARGEHIDDNYRATDLELDPEDVERIENIDREHRIVRADTGPWTW